MRQGKLFLVSRTSIPPPHSVVLPLRGRKEEGGAIVSGENKEDGIPTKKSRNRLPIAGLPYFITFADTQPCIIASISSGVTRFCSPLTMFFSITLPSAISVSPTMATYGICFTLAYCICFFILALSG